MKIIDVGTITLNPDEWLEGGYTIHHKAIYDAVKIETTVMYPVGARWVWAGTNNQANTMQIKSGENTVVCVPQIRNFPFFIKEFVIDIAVLHRSACVPVRRRDVDAYLEYYGDY